MLRSLKVSNFALIEDIELDFKNGFTVITGETGAGKSILIDAISYVLGTKFNREFIRYGEDRTFVKAVFDTPDNLIERFRNKKLTIERENTSSGKSFAKINGESVNVSDVKDIARYLLDIHGQHNNQNLLNPEMHIAYLDLFADINNKKEFINYRIKHSHMKELENKLNTLNRGNEREKIMDFLRFQIDEIKKSRISVYEEAELLKKSDMLNHSQKIGEALKLSSEVLNGEDNNVVFQLGLVVKQLNSIKDVMPDVTDTLKIIEESYYNLSEAARDTESLKSSVYFDEIELDEVNQRLFTYHSLKKKYGSDVSQILEYLDEKEKELFELENREEIIEKLKSEISLIKKELIKQAESIHEIRSKAAVKLSKEINAELKQVGLGKADFMPEVTHVNLLMENGSDSVSFMISTNTGEPRKPLEKIVSGGELSRIMLAMKSVFINKDNIPSVIFDEIDTGISGSVAEAVGRKMYDISKNSQVFCVTHLPQIAAYSDNHMIARKEEENNRTFSRIFKADSSEKTREIANMLSGSKVTDKTLESAEELILSIDKNKSK